MGGRSVAELADLADAPVDAAWIAVASSLHTEHPATAEESVQRLRVLHRLESIVSSWRIEETERLARLMDGDPTRDDDMIEVDWEVAAATRTGVGLAASRVDRAHELLTRLPLTFGKLRDGHITEWHATTLIQLGQCARTDEDAERGLNLLAELEEELWSRLPGQPTVQQVRDRARRLLLRRDPKAFARRRETAQRAADVTVRHEELTGMAWLSAYMSSEYASIVINGLKVSARSLKAAGDERSLGQIKAAQLANWCMEKAWYDAPPPTSHGRPVELQVVAPLETVLGIADDPGEIPGESMLPAEVIRDLARDAKVRLLTVDGPTGRLLDYGHTTYRVPAELRDCLSAAWPLGAGPLTSTPARECDFDHNQPWPVGTTSYDNIRPLGRRAHRLKTRAGWSYVTDNGSGQTRWRTRLGQELVIEMYDYGFHQPHSP